MKGKAQVASAVGLNYRRQTSFSHLGDQGCFCTLGAVVITASQMELVIYHQVASVSWAFLLCGYALVTR